jgi:hypothetical protein
LPDWGRNPSLANMKGDSASDKRLLARALGNLGATVRAHADEVGEHELGWLVRTPSLPVVWALNQLRVSGDSGAGEVLAVADKVQGACSANPRTAW